MAVLVCQIYTLPEIQRVLVQNTRDTKASILINLLGSIYGVWNFPTIHSSNFPAIAHSASDCFGLSVSSVSNPYPGGFLYASTGT